MRQQSHNNKMELRQKRKACINLWNWLTEINKSQKKKKKKKKKKLETEQSPSMFFCQYLIQTELTLMFSNFGCCIFSRLLREHTSSRRAVWLLFTLFVRFNTFISEHGFTQHGAWKREECRISHYLSLHVIDSIKHGLFFLDYLDMITDVDVPFGGPLTSPRVDIVLRLCFALFSPLGLQG